jgi:hypothetical protein
MYGSKPSALTGTSYDPLDATFVGLMLEMNHGHLGTILFRRDEVVYGFRDHALTLKSKQVTERANEEKPRFLSFLSEFYETQITNFSVYENEIKFSGDLRVLGKDLRDFRKDGHAD